MKKLLFILLLLPLFGHSQIFGEMGAGVETNNYHSVIKLAAGVDIKNVSLELVEQVTLTRAVNSPNYFGVKGGYNFFNFVPAVGYYYNYRNADNKSMNHAAAGYSLKYILMLSEPGGLYAEALYIEKSVQFTVGFHVKF